MPGSSQGHGEQLRPRVGGPDAEVRPHNTRMSPSREAPASGRKLKRTQNAPQSTPPPEQKPPEPHAPSELRHEATKPSPSGKVGMG